jgi:SAM-dependent methyltransferase
MKDEANPFPHSLFPVSYLKVSLLPSVSSASSVSKLLAILFFATATAAAQTPTYTPVPGQPGKDVVWIPTPEDTVEKMLDMARVTPKDFVVDLGSGDGRNVIAAARRGARALGVEYNPDLVALSKRAAAAAGVADKATFVQGDMFEADISKATVLMLFLLPDHMERLTPKFLQLTPGARVVSNTFGIGGWEPDATTRGEPCTSWCVAMLYVVPARVAGAWRLDDGATLTLEQHYQKLTGTLENHGIDFQIENGRLDGEIIRFTVNRVHYQGRVSGEGMTGSAAGRTTHAWTATRQ